LTADTMIVSQQDGTVAVIDTRTSKWVYEIIQSITSGWVLSLIQDLINWRLFYLHNKMKTAFIIRCYSAFSISSTVLTTLWKRLQTTVTEHLYFMIDMYVKSRENSKHH
jgi:hypothetical protein